ncbi:hypothetical protein EWH99_11020 [Sporolactobacillus sp. THM7-7]|nr:hypothetical protein EWH99_11020 [Sporolactobacillus sp. THM7-7]
MNILLVSNMYPNNSNPQFGIFVKNTADILENNRIHVKKVVLYKTKGRWKKLFSYGAFYIKIIGNLLFKRYDCVYIHYASHNAIPVLFAKGIKKRLKIVTNVHGSDVVPETGLQEKLQKYVTKLLKASEIVITPSNYYKQLVANKYHLDERKISVFPSGGVNKQTFKVIGDKKFLLINNGLDPNQQYIGYVGRIDVQKGWDVFLEAVRQLKRKRQIIPTYKKGGDQCIIHL